MFDQLRAAIKSKRLTPEQIDDLLREAEEIEQADLRERLRGSLYEFIKYFWHVLEPDTRFVGGWPLEAMCLHLEAITKGQIKRLLINIPPGAAKSLVSNVFWPAWEWCQGGALAGKRYLCFSYAQHLTIRDNGGQEGRLSRLLTSVDYQTLFSNVFKITTNQATKISNDKTGWKIASSIGGLGTGERGDRIVCFPYSENVLTAQGPMPIGKIVEERLDIRVWAMDPRNRRIELKPIVGWHKNPGRPLIKIKTAKGSVTCTHDHRIMTDRGWVPAESLVIGDRLFAAPRWMHVSPTPIGREQIEIEVPPRPPVTDAIDSSDRDTELSRKNFCRAVPPGCNLPNHVFGQSTSPIRGPQIKIEMLPDAPIANPRNSLMTDAKFSREHLCRAIVSSSDLSNDLLSQMQGAIPERAVDLAVGDVLGAGAVFEVNKARIRAVPILMPDFLSKGHRTEKSQSHKLMAEEIESLATFPHCDARIPLIENRCHDAAWHAHGTPSPRDDTGDTAHAPEIGNLVKPFKANYGEPVLAEVVSIDIIHDIPSETYCLTVADHHTFCCGDNQYPVCSNCDDPHNVREGESQVVRTMTVEWFANAMSNRLNSMDESVILVIAQRVHEADVSGYILEKELPYEHLMIPAYSDGRRWTTSIGWIDPRTEADVNFWPERYSDASLAQLKATMLPFAWSSQYQQTPMNRGGNLFKTEWWVPWDPQEARKWGVKYPSYPRFDLVIGAVDGAYTDKTQNDPSAMTVWGVWNVPGRPTGVMLLAAWQAHLEFHQLLSRVAETASLWKLDKLLVEGKATGKSIVQELMRVYNHAPWQANYDKRGIVAPNGQYIPLHASRDGWEMPTEGSAEYPTSWSATSWSVEEIDVRGRLAHGVRNDKLSRATSVAGLWFEGIVHAPMIRLKDAEGDYTGEYSWATYAQMLINQMAVFPHGAHDDLSDTAVIALRWLRDMGFIKSGREATYAYRLESQSHRQLSLPPIYPT